MIADERRGLIWWGWVGDHLDDIWQRTVEHVQLTAIALVVGCLISFALALLAVRVRWTYAPIRRVASILYTIPSLALFAALVPITGFSPFTALFPLVLYTILILVRNIVAGFDSVPADVLEAANGMGYARDRRLWRVELPLAIPLIVAGLRVATVSTIGLVTITATIGDRYGGLGFFILEGWRRAFPTEILFGAIPSMLLAIAADLTLQGIERRATPWSRPSPVPGGSGGSGGGTPLATDLAGTGRGAAEGHA